MTNTGQKLTLSEVDRGPARGPFDTTYRTLSEVAPGQVRLVAGLDLLGWDEFRGVVLVVTWIVGTGLGLWLARLVLDVLR